MNLDAIVELDKRGRSFGTQGNLFEYRADPKLTASENRQLNGYAIVFNRFSQDLGGFIEQVAPEAVNRMLRDGSDVGSLIDHDWHYILGRRNAGNVRYEKDTFGLRVITDPSKTTYAADLIENIQQRIVSGMSFGFITLEDQWDFKSDPPRRTLLDLKIPETSIVARPAYLDTSVGVRAFQEVAKYHGAWKPSLAFRERELRAREANRR